MSFYGTINFDIFVQYKIWNILNADVFAIVRFQFIYLYTRVNWTKSHKWRLQFKYKRRLHCESRFITIYR